MKSEDRLNYVRNNGENKPNAQNVSKNVHK